MRLLPLNGQWPGVFVLTFLLVVGTTCRSEAEEKVIVGSKAFTESVILGDMLATLARHEGYQVEHRAELGGTQVLWKALLAREIDVYVEYTGTIEQEILGGASASEEEMRSQLATKQVVMSAPLGFNNTYAIGVKQTNPRMRDVYTISDLKQHPDFRMGFSDEFLERQDGWPGLKSRYQLPQTDVRGMMHNLAYRGIEHGSLDCTDCYSTDPEIAYYGLRILRDDLSYFPSYRAVVLFRQDLIDRAPKFIEAVDQLVGRISNDSMTRLNLAVQIDRQPEIVVAARFLQENIDSSIVVPENNSEQRWQRAWQRLLQNTWQHLFLVSVSLLAAIALAIPLGVAAYQWPRLGQVILGVVGVIQTLPSMALLVFMVPILGLGAWPAIVALFLYSLLPIVRNTYTGLNNLPGHLHESAEALGLPAMARLRLIELPMASRSILAGIKTAAVINVGTATIGAFIGAGGYGQPILTGIRLDDVPLILEGAIPAAVLALLVQGLFGLSEKWLVPRGLRI